MMVKVTIDSIRVSLMSQLRLVVLKDTTSERYLTIFIGSFEAEAIAVKLRGEHVERPLTHDLLKSSIETLGGELQRIVISDLSDDIFYANLIVGVGNDEVEIDSRPSDAIALAVRVDVPLYVAESVMERASSMPDEEIDIDSFFEPDGETSDEQLSAFKDFVDTLDMDDLET